MDSRKIIDYTEVELVNELWRRGISLDYIVGAYMALENIEASKLDDIFGNDEQGQHGKDSNKK